MANIIKFGGGLVISATSSVPVIGTDFNWTGSDNSYIVLNDGDNNWRIKFLSSGTFTPLKDMTIDVFLVGGGGGGTNGMLGNVTGGGGSGYTTTVNSVQLTANTEYSIVVGAGGTAKNNGGDSIAFETTAKGGYAASGVSNDAKGGNGGSGGGGRDTGEGGVDGANGGGVNGGTGQGTTTREFGESTGDLYATGGGGSGSSTAGESGAPNTGDGGGGSPFVNAGEGGSGIVIIRKHEEIYSASITPKSGVSYTNGLEGLSADDISLFSAAISNNSDITNETSVVYLDYGNIHRTVSVGDQVTLSLNGTDYAFDIIGFNHDDLTTSTTYGKETATGKAGMTLQMHDLFATIYQMNSTDTNSGGWKSSAMRTSTMATMKGYLPDDWEAIIKTVNKSSCTGGGSSSGTEIVSDSCFLLAEIEVFGSYSNSVSGEGTQYAYYKAGNSKIKSRSGTANSWWTRSANNMSGGEMYFCGVTSGGKSSLGKASTSLGVSFGFCV